MIPSPRLMVMILAAAPLLLAGAFVPPLVAAGVIYLLILAGYAVIDILLLPRRKAFTVRRIVPGRISLGVATRIRLEITNASRRKVEISLAEDLPEGFEADPPECKATFDPGASGVLEYRLTARRRGRHELAGMDVRVLPAMGLFYRQFRLGGGEAIHVYPNLVNLKRYEVLLRRGLTQQGLARLRRIGDGSEFESLMLYAEGDDMSRVDWKATARRSQLVVKNYQPERQQSIVVAIDAGRATAGEFAGISRLDYLVNAALMLAYVALRQGDWFSLVAFSDRIESYLPPVRLAGSIDHVAEALYKLQPRLVQSDYAAACRFLGLKTRKRSLICLMTDIIDRHASGEILSYMARFARRHLALAVTLSNPEIQALAAERLADASDPYSKAAAIDVLNARSQAVAAMRRTGVDVLDVAPLALTPDLINRYLTIKAARRL